MDRWKQAYGATSHRHRDRRFASGLHRSPRSHPVPPAAGNFSSAKPRRTSYPTSNERVGRLLEDSRRQTAEITQISELGSLLQACASREEVFRLIPERLRRLFPDASGSVSLLTASKARLETVAAWGIGPAGQIVSPTECWALRRGSVHVHPRGRSGARCSHFLGDGASICIPLIADRGAIGILAIQENDFATDRASESRFPERFPAQRRLSK